MSVDRHYASALSIWYQDDQDEIMAMMTSKETRRHIRTSV